MTKLTIIFITILAIIILGFMVIDDANGQGRTLIYEYNNTQREDLGGGKKRFTMEMATPYRLYEHSDTLINESSWGSIKWKINGKNDYKINRVGRGAAFEETYDIDSDSFEVEYFIDDNIEMQLDDDTTKFVKNGKVIYRNTGMTILNDGIKLNKTKPKVWKNKLKVKFNRPDKLKKAKVDPIWTWTPDSTVLSNDSYVQGNQPTTNYNDKTYIYMYGSGVPLVHGLIEFIGLVDSLSDAVTIDSAAVICSTVTAYPTKAQTSFMIPLAAAFDEETVTAANKPDSLSVITYNSDTLNLTTANQNSWIQWDVKSSVQAMIDLTISSYGWEMQIEGGATDGQLQVYSSMATTGRPYIYVDYTELSTAQKGILKSPLNGTIVKSVENGTIRRKVNYP